MTNADASKALGSVLVATDFSDSAWSAAERAARLPLRRGARLALLHVLPVSRDYALAERLESDASRRLDDVRERLLRSLGAAGHGDRHAVVTVTHGKPFVEIVRQARHGRADLIVVGRHGERTFHDLLIGSTAERVIRKGDTSVLVIAAPPAGPYRRPLVATDLSDSSRHALDLTLRLADPAAERIDVVHVVELPIGHAAGAEAALGLEALRLEREQQARYDLNAVLDPLADPGRWNVIVRTGDPRQVILDEARARGADLVAVGTDGRAGLSHVLIGSVAEGVIRGAACDVLVARLPRAGFTLP